MNYQHIYNQIIDRAKSRILEGYKERHHIIPKCLGGDNSQSNLVDLTAREHFLCHLFLVRIYPQNRKLASALWFMCNRHNRLEPVTISSRTYSEAKVHLFSLGLSEETKSKIRIARTGVPRSKEMKQNLSKAKTGKKQTQEHIEAIVQAKLKKGTKRTQEQRDVMSSRALGRKCSEEHKENNRRARLSYYQRKREDATYSRTN